MNNTDNIDNLNINNKIENNINEINNEECVCCLNIVKNKLECSHYIHLKCICLSGKLECPICRYKLNENYFSAELLMVYDKKKIELKKYNQEHEFQLINDVVNEVNEENNMTYVMEDMLSRLLYGYD